MRTGAPIDRLTTGHFFRAVSNFAVCRNVSDVVEYPLHWHEFYEFEYVVSGCGTMRLNGRAYRLRAGVMYLLTPADFHEVKVDPGLPLELLNVKFSDDLLDNDLKLILLSSRAGEAVVDSDGTDGIGSRLQELLREDGSHGIGSELLVKYGIADALIRYCRCRQGAEGAATNRYPVPGPSESMHKALFYMQYHFRELLPLAQMAKMANLSAHYFSELFHASFGVTFQKHLQQLRLNHARDLLLASKLPVTEICFLSGFNSLPNFNRAFKGAFGLSPQGFRKQEGGR